MATQNATNAHFTKAEDWYGQADEWRPLVDALRRILLECDLQETLKWRQPCYTHGGKNIAIVGRMKDHCVLSFFKGALLTDADGLLEAAGPNTRSAKVMRLRSVEAVHTAAPKIGEFVAEAITLTQAGARVAPAPKAPYAEELQAHMAQDPAFKAAFEALTPGRQRAYNMHFSQAKQSATRKARIIRLSGRILDGKGLNDCICGQSRRPPGCDGSHRQIKDWKRPYA